MYKSGTFKTACLFTMTTCLFVAAIAGCELMGGGLLPFPTGQITSVQLGDEPNYTVAFDVESSAIKQADIAKVNWVFGDGGGFVEGSAGATYITHQYLAAGTFEVSAFLFNEDGFVVQVDGTVVVKEDGTGPEPTPGDEPGQIVSASPDDEEENVDVETTLTWIEGEYATSHDVYFGTDETAVENATRATAGIFRGNQTDVEYDAGELLPDTEYFWRIDEVNDAGTTKGDVMSFTTALMPESIDDPIPADGVTTAPVTQVLQWTPGDEATSHDVYFGKDLAAVTDATDEDEDVFMGNQTGSTYDPEDEDAEIDGQLLADTTYYWRIDEVGPGGTFKGDVLTFKTAAPPAQITSPNPADGAVDVNVEQSLNWIAAPAIDSFDVYFGIDAVAVGNAKRTSPEFKGNQTSKTFNPGDLLGSTVYYWRVDTLGDGGTTKGAVLTFTTADPPAQVAAPFDPADTATNVDVDATLSWNVGVGGGTTTSFDVYFSSDENAVATGLSSALQGNQGVANTVFDPNGMEADTVYYWRIDAVGPGGSTAGSVLTFRTGALPDEAEAPSPANNSVGVALDVVLGWTAGNGAESHHVYLGKNEQDVTSAGIHDSEYKGDQVGTTYTPAAELLGNTEYFWRIDEVAAGGVTKGTVWAFTTAPGRAKNPSPLNGKTSVALDVVLSWTAGTGATGHDVYFGEVEADIEAATTASAEYEGEMSSAEYTPVNLLGDTTYYWRVDSVDADGYVTKGTVWHFTTAAPQAENPSPANGANNVPVTTDLTWTLGAGADTQDVYFGTDSSAVGSATHASAEFMVTLDAGTTVYDPAGDLALDTTYFWRVDTIDADGNVTAGDVWQFHTAAVLPPEATENPFPSDGDVGLAQPITLMWDAVADADSYDVYLGTTVSSVASATKTSEQYKGSRTGNTYTTGELNAGTTYFWRIDAVNDGGATASEVWRFTTAVEPGKATSPSPSNAATGVLLDTLLEWTAGSDADTHEIYFGTSLSAVANGVLPDATTSIELFDPSSIVALAAGTTYFWRVDEVASDGVSTTKGTVWRFTTLAAPAIAGSPTPANNAVNQDLDTVIGWAAAQGATSYDVYFVEETYNASLPADERIGDVTPASELYVGNQTTRTYDPGTLSASTTYLWRIDTVNDVGETVGVVWRFTTEP